MTWQELSITVPHEYVEPISYLFDRYGHGLSMELLGPNQVLLRTYLQDSSRYRLARIEVGVKLASLLQPLGELTLRPLSQDEDWQNAWKAHFSLLRVGDRLVIKPSWIEYQAKPGDVVIELDPGLAFGTGYHPTTYTCLAALETLVQPGMAVLDLGTGSGILTIAAVKLGAAQVTAVDIDTQAVRAARQNFRRTGILNQVSLIKGSLPHPQVLPQQFDLALANISARGVRERAPAILPALKLGGKLIASGIIQEQYPEVRPTLEELGFSPIEEWPREDWITLVCHRPA
ncbi:MAG TPA: 50S ribosomal protein L11 methyltransferase [Dehalococcoidia bacterium]|nr:50S ribosomal protein L11 methyltransferase [Dehalococcoidia bacterium]